MGQVRVQQTDAHTGEVLEGALVFVPAKRRNAFGQGWVAMGQGPMAELAKSKLGLQAHRVMWALLARLDFENLINVSQADVARDLGMDRAAVSRAIAQLVDEGAVLAGPTVGRNRTYRLNPHYGWKGSAKGHHEAISAATREARARASALGLAVLKGGQTDAGCDPAPDAAPPDAA
jgi:biotin operon repressor